MITRVLWSACLVAVMVAGPGISAAENSRVEPPLRLEWEADPPRDGVQAVCGRVINDRSATAWHVILLVEELDGAERVTNSRQVEVMGEVPSEGYAFFCVPQTGATAYRVRVIGADWMSSTAEQPAARPHGAGSSATLHPPPSAFTSSTLAPIRRRRMSISFRWFGSAAVWALIT